MIVGMAYVGSSRNRYISKLIIYIFLGKVFTCTVVHVADVEWQLICLLSPERCIGRQGICISGTVGILC